MSSNGGINTKTISIECPRCGRRTFAAVLSEPLFSKNTRVPKLQCLECGAYWGFKFVEFVSEGDV